MRAWSLVVFVCVQLHANPYPDPDAVPKDGYYEPDPTPLIQLDPQVLRSEGHDVLRVEVAWNKDETYEIATTTIERSGTDALLKRALSPDPLGSYEGTLVDPETGHTLYYDSIGTGMEYRLLSRALTFRFPSPAKRVEFVLKAENPKTGVREEVLRRVLLPARERQPADDFEVRLIRAADVKPALIINLYSEGYLAGKKEQFWNDAKKTADKLKESNFPGFSRFEFQAVWSPSNNKTGEAVELGLPVPERDTFLGLYYPYWNPFGRWYHVMYPTRESRYRRALGKIPYDYPIALVDNSIYWGVGNFNELTAIPSGSYAFTYLLLHELGHFFGLNEEYEGGGPTELRFAPGIHEPWSQNITFLRDPQNLKWKQFTQASTPVPTPSSHWQGGGPYGAYKGGYADTEPLKHSHKPGFNCVMHSGSKFCPVCVHAIEAKVKHDLGE